MIVPAKVTVTTVEAALIVTFEPVSVKLSVFKAVEAAGKEFSERPFPTSVTFIT